MEGQMIFDALENRAFAINWGSLSGDDLPDYVEVLKVDKGGWLLAQPLYSDGRPYGDVLWLSPAQIAYLAPFRTPAGPAGQESV